MNKKHTIEGLLSTLGISLIVIALIILGVTDKDSFVEYTSNSNVLATDIKYVKESNIKEVAMVTIPDSKIQVANALQGNIYSGETKEEVAAKLNRYLGTDLLANKGDLIAGYSISLGIDPYLAAAIMLHETGCGSSCSQLVRSCNNVAGQKGAPACSGSYKGYATIDDGIRGAIDNIYYNYYVKGLTTAEAIAPRYAESGTWIYKVNGFMNKLKS